MINHCSPVCIGCYAVLWNPWAEKAASMSDFADDGYKHMVCVEPGFVANRKVLQPNEVFSCSQTLKIC